MSDFKPFSDDSHIIGADGLAIENGMDAVSIHGSIEIRKDKAGLAHAQKLAAAFSAIAETLEKIELPDQAESDQAEEGTVVKNPFE